MDTATEYDVALGHRQPGETLSVVHLQSRWPELKILAPRGLELQRAKATSKDCVENYYKALEHILTKYHLCDRPERLYNVDEKGLSTRNKPPPVVSGNIKSQAVVSATRMNVTVLGCGNAQGQQIPPYFVFPGIRMNSALLSGSTPGADGTVSESGWSNSEIFQKYLQSHLIKYLPERSESCPVVIFYDGHRSHVNLGLVQWARQENIVLFVLPAHTSHVLQPMDVGCFGPFEMIFNRVAHKFMRESCGRSITKFDICKLACSAYTKALSPENLQSAFRRSGIFPLNPQVVNQSCFLPSTVLEQENRQSMQSSQPVLKQSTQPGFKPSAQPGFEPSSQSDTEPYILTDSATPISKTPVSPTSFFSHKETPLTCKKPQTKKRKYLSSIVSGRAITEDDMFEAILDHEAARKQPSTKGKGKMSCDKGKSNPKSVTTNPNPVPSTSGRQSGDSVNDDDDDSQIDVVQCDSCGQWTHLKYCTDVSVIRRGVQFLCKHCTQEE